MKEQLGIDERGKTAIDLVVNVSGAEVSIQTGIIVARQGGTFVHVCVLRLLVSLGGLGQYGHARDCYPVTILLTREINFKGSFRYGARLFRFSSDPLHAHIHLTAR